jgi:ATP-dependent DNA helicase RecG
MGIKEDIKKGENKQLEFKKRLPSGESLAKTIVAFSNTGGGRLIIGVNDDHTIEGINEDKIFEMEEKISSIIADSCHPVILPEIYTLNVDGKILLVVEVFRGNLLPYYLKSLGKLKGTFVRIGSTNRKADELMIEELERQKRKQGFDEEENREYNLDELNLNIIYDEFKKQKKKANIQKLKNLKLVNNIHGKDYPTNALLIALGIPENTTVKCARFKGTSTATFIDKKEFEGDLFEKLEQTINFLKNHLNLNAEIKGLQREEDYEIPVVALREALLNAFVHRDYIRNRDIKVAVFDDIVEIISPGALPHGITLDDISNGRSELRNKVLAKLFKELGYIETWGSGIARIKEICSENHIDFSIKETGDFVQVTFVRPQENARKKTPARKLMKSKLLSIT